MAYQSNALQEDDERADDRLVGTDFLNRKSMNAVLHTRLERPSGNDGAEAEDAANEAYYEEAARRRALRRARRYEMVGWAMRASGLDNYEQILELIKEMGFKKALGETAKNIAQALILIIARPWIFAIALKFYVIQLIFAAFSLAGFAMHAATLELKEGTTLGQIVGYFWNFEDYLPGIYIGYGAWAIALVVGMAGFLCFMLFFHLLKIDLIKGWSSLLTLTLCLSLTILPISNIFPWLLLWIYMVIRAETSVFRMFMDYRHTKHGGARNFQNTMSNVATDIEGFATHADPEDSGRPRERTRPHGDFSRRTPSRPSRVLRSSEY